MYTYRLTEDKGETMEQLIGKTINKLEVSENQLLLRFTDSEGVKYIYAATGDCCSETWWADISISKQWSADSLPVEIYGEYAVKMPLWCEKSVNRDGKCRQEFDKVYGHNLRTSRGSIEIIYRNSSNGYYGGDFEFVESYNSSYRDEIEGNWTNITEDWSA